MHFRTKNEWHSSWIAPTSTWAFDKAGTPLKEFAARHDYSARLSDAIEERIFSHLPEEDVHNVLFFSSALRKNSRSQSVEPGNFIQLNTKPPEGVASYSTYYLLALFSNSASHPYIVALPVYRSV